MRAIPDRTFGRSRTAPLPENQNGTRLVRCTRGCFMTTKSRFKDVFEVQTNVDEIIIEVSQAMLPQRLLTEGGWIKSGKGGWMMRVDAARPEMHQRRHVHIARKKHTANKGQQASWNDDRTRHDRKTFNASVGAMNVVQGIARKALSLPDDAVLEHLVASASEMLVDQVSTNQMPKSSGWSRSEQVPRPSLGASDLDRHLPRGDPSGKCRRSGRVGAELRDGGIDEVA
jgi:hypothetical protein